VDEESRWQAEWNTMRALQLAGKSGDALRRVDSLGPGIGISPELQLRFLWLAAQVSLDARRPEETEERATRVRAFLDGAPGGSIDPGLRADVLSNLGLVSAEARMLAGDREVGRQAVERLRAEFPNSPAADYSFIVESGFLAEENRLVEAMQLLLTLADTRPESKYAPVALYQAALLNIRRGQEEHLNEANRLLDRMALRYPDESFDFPARLKQADVMRRLGRFNDAEAIYRSLESKYPNHRERAIVQISLADALMAQATNDPGKFQDAVSRLERLMAAESLPVDLRAEAGVKLGAGWQTQGNPARAAEIYWEIYQRFLEMTPASSLGATGPHWISRALFALGEIEERASRIDNARVLYQALLDHGLPGDKVAEARLARISAPAAGG
jgi:cellulose synthase operon protein C